jgi:hypothetical protein
MLGSLSEDADGRSVLEPLCAGGVSEPMLFGGVGNLGLEFGADAPELRKSYVVLVLTDPSVERML